MEWDALKTGQHLPNPSNEATPSVFLRNASQRNELRNRFWIHFDQTRSPVSKCMITSCFLIIDPNDTVHPNIASVHSFQRKMHQERVRFQMAPTIPFDTLQFSASHFQHFWQLSGPVENGGHQSGGSKGVCRRPDRCGKRLQRHTGRW